MAKKQYGWMVRDPKGNVIQESIFGGVVFNSRANAIYVAKPIHSDATKWWREARREGYTVERIEL